MVVGEWQTETHIRESIVAHINFEWGYLNGLFKGSSGNAEPSRLCSK